LRANGRAGQAQPNGGASRNRDTKNNFGLKKGGLARLRREEDTAGKNFLSPDPFPFLPAVPLNLGRKLLWKNFF
jgi:hypothetical protein